jgi:DNA invertase Pin-like site-specific DNA recombinase
MEEPMRIALYARVSTGDQDCEPQLQALRQYAKGMEATEYVEEGVSGSRVKRPALDQLLADARRRRFDAVACVKLDRMARSVRHLTTLAGEFEALDIDFVVLDQGIDTSTPTGRLLFHTLAAIAEFERDLIAERTRAGLRAAKRNGKRLGRPRAIRGPATYQLQRMMADNVPVHRIAEELGVSQATVVRTAKRLEL